MALLSEYGFNEGSGSTAADSSGNGRNLTVVSGSPWTANGHSGNSASGGSAGRFEGFFGPDQSQTSWTVMCWVKFNSLPPPGAWNQFVYVSGGSSLWMQINADSGAGTFRFDAYSGVSEPVTPYNYSTGNWYHVAAVYNGTTSWLVIDGTKILTGGSSGGALNFGAAGSWCEVGSYGHANTTFGPLMDGYVDDLRVFDEPLTEAQITTFMNTPVGGSSTDATFSVGSAKSSISTNNILLSGIQNPTMQVGAGRSLTKSGSVILAANSNANMVVGSSKILSRAGSITFSTNAVMLVGSTQNLVRSSSVVLSGISNAIFNVGSASTRARTPNTIFVLPNGIMIIGSAKSGMAAGKITLSARQDDGFTLWENGQELTPGLYVWSNNILVPATMSVFYQSP